MNLLVNPFLEQHLDLSSQLKALGLDPAREKTDIPKIPTGIIRLDVALRGGLPTLTEVYGEDSVGKTALLGRVMSQAQNMGMPVFLCVGDYLDKLYLERLGVDLENLAILLGGRPTFEEELLCVGMLPVPVLIVIDSMTSIRPRDSESAVSMWTRILSTLKSKVMYGSGIVGSSQVRSKGLRNRKVNSASRKLSEVFDCRVQLERTRVREHSFDLILDIKKSMAGPPTVFELPMRKGEGIQSHLDAIRLAKEVGVVELRGPNIYFKTSMIGKGEIGAAKALEESPELYELLLHDILQ